jgi:hypothetical protein
MTIFTLIMTSSLLLNALVSNPSINDEHIKAIDSLISDTEPNNDDALVINGSKILTILENNRNSIVFYNGQTLYNLCQSMNIRQDSDTTILLKYINSKVQSERIIAEYILTKFFFRSGNINKAAFYYHKLEKHPRSYIHELISSDYADHLLDVEKMLRSLEIKNINDDERLWLQGELLFKAMQVPENESESSYDLSYPIRLLQTICDKYPTSKWADKAAFKLLSYYEGFAHEHGEADTSCITGYKDFIKKYPSSIYRNDAMAEIASHLILFVQEKINGQEYNRSELLILLARAEKVYNTLGQKNIDNDFRMNITDALANITQLRQALTNKNDQ